MQITWYGHSCFKISHDGYSVVIDPYDLKNARYPELHVEADAVICSHEHRGHNNRDAVKLSGTSRPCPYKLTPIESYHDTLYGKFRGGNTVHIIEWDGYKIVHMGDFNTFANEDDKFKLMDADVLMINAGSLRSLPSDQTKPLADELRARIIIPMHYMHDGIGNMRIGKLEEFTDQYPDQRFIHFYDTNTIEIDHDMPDQVAVLKYIQQKPQNGRKQMWIAGKFTKFK